MRTVAVRDFDVRINEKDGYRKELFNCGGRLFGQRPHLLGIPSDPRLRRISSILIGWKLLTEHRGGNYKSMTHHPDAKSTNYNAFAMKVRYDLSVPDCESDRFYLLW